MGTQQILLIVLSVIIVAIATGLGLSTFHGYAYGANKSALAGDAQLYAAWILQYYMTSKAQGGLGESVANIDAEDINQFLGGERDKFSTVNGVFRAEIPQGDSLHIHLIGIGSAIRKGKSPRVETSINLKSGIIRSRVSDIDS